MPARDDAQIKPFSGIAAVSVARTSKTYFISFHSLKEGDPSIITDLQGPFAYTLLTYLTTKIIITKYEASLKQYLHFEVWVWH